MSARVGQMSAVCVTFRPSGVPEWLLACIATKRSRHRCGARMWHQAGRRGGSLGRI